LHFLHRFAAGAGRACGFPAGGTCAGIAGDCHSPVDPRSNRWCRNQVAEWKPGAGLVERSDKLNHPAHSGRRPECLSVFVGTEIQRWPQCGDLLFSDFNGDGIPDLAVSNFGNLSTNLGGNIAIYFGKSDGTFSAGPTVNAGSTPAAMYSADFNGDGRMDLAVGSATTDQISILFGKGDGTFQAAASYPLTDSPHSIVSADFNGDGQPDLAVATYLGKLAILLGNGGGTFKPAVMYSDGNGKATDIAALDLIATASSILWWIIRG
jgi:hypothetical protein